MKGIYNSLKKICISKWSVGRFWRYHLACTAHSAHFGGFFCLCTTGPSKAPNRSFWNRYFFEAYICTFHNLKSNLVELFFVKPMLRIICELQMGLRSQEFFFQKHIFFALFFHFWPTVGWGKEGTYVWFDDPLVLYTPPSIHLPWEDMKFLKCLQYFFPQMRLQNWPVNNKFITKNWNVVWYRVSQKNTMFEKPTSPGFF